MLMKCTLSFGPGFGVHTQKRTTPRGVPQLSWMGIVSSTHIDAAKGPAPGGYTLTVTFLSIISQKKCLYYFLAWITGLLLAGYSKITQGNLPLWSQVI